MSAQVAAASQAVAAAAANDVTFGADPVTRLEIHHIRAELDYASDEFVTYGHRHRDRALGPRVPVPDVDIGAADRRLIDAD